MRFLSLLAFVPAAFSASLTLRISPSTLLPNPATLPPSTHATLHLAGKPHTAPLTRRHTFEFEDLVPGSYLATVHCRDYVFESLRVDVRAGDETVGADGKKVGSSEERIVVWQTFRGHEWDNKGEKRGEGRRSTVVDVRAAVKKDYYQIRQGFSPLSFLKNPMILMGLFSLVLIFGMPYLMENMDEETKADFDEMAKQSPLASENNPAAKLQNFDFASWMAGKTDSGSSTPTASSGTEKKKKR